VAPWCELHFNETSFKSLPACWRCLRPRGLRREPATLPFYVDAMTPGVARVMNDLDVERRAVAAAFGIELPCLIDEMRAIGTVSPDAPSDDLVAAISAGEANKRIKGPDTLRHRYFMEDFGYGLTPFLAFAGIAGVGVPVAASLSRLGDIVRGVPAGEGRTAQSMGIDGMTRDALLEAVNA
jgi:opine dehydrogenase